MKIRSGAAIVAACALLAAPAGAEAASMDTYVDDDSANLGPTCPLANPCQRIDIALLDTLAGGTVHVAPGTYSGAAHQNMAVGGGRSVIHEGAQFAAILDSGGTFSSIDVQATGAGTISGFDFVGHVGIQLQGNATITGNRFSRTINNAQGVSTNGTVTSTTTISNNQFTDAPGATDTKFGVSLGAGATPVIQNNLFANLSNAINVLGASPQIVGNEFTGVHYDGGGGGFGVKVREGGASGSNPTIAENFFHDAPLPDNNTSAVSVAKVANNINPVGATLRRNRIFDHGSGVVVFDTNAPVTLDGDLVLASSNSIDIGESTAIPGDGDVTATNITAGAIRLVGNAMEDPDLTLDSSIVSFIYDPGATSETHGCVITFSRGNATGSLDNGCDTYLTTADPQFIDDDPPFGDWENNDYRLAAGSPLIDAGNPAASGSLALGGNARAIPGTCGAAARRDIGAYEFDPGCPPAAGAGGAGTGDQATPPKKKCKKGQKLKKGKCKKKRKRRKK